MGILKLMTLIGDYAPNAIKEFGISHYFGRKVAIDASMCLYQFMISIRYDGDVLMNESGEVTSHLMGMLYRTCRMLEHGIKPVYVFDGKPPVMKSGELAKRQERRQQAETDLEEAKEVGDDEDVKKIVKRTVKITSTHVEDCKKLLELLGVPFMVAPCEAEAQCAELTKSGKVYAAASEDMDTLTFGSNILLRNLMSSEAKKLPVREVHLNQVLDTVNLNQEEFIDLCILMGCDYTGSIKGIGYKRALALMVEHRSIEEILKHLDKDKFPPPQNWNFSEARELFLKPEITPGEGLNFNWSSPNEEMLVEFLVGEKGFNEDRVRAVCKRIEKSKDQSSQARMDSFFKVLPSVPEKRKLEATSSGAKKAKLSNGKPASASSSGKGKIKKKGKLN